MFAYIEGKFVERNPSFLIVDCHGIGYSIEISLTTYTDIKEKESGKILTHFIVREDAQILYGFSTEKERTIFRHLISVSGVGANTARMMLSSSTPDELISAISSGNINVLQSIKGIGTKTAQRIVLEIKDKIAKETLGTTNFIFPQDNIIRSEALSALVMLGFSKSQSEKVVDKIIKSIPDISVEELIKQALKNF